MQSAAQNARRAKESAATGGSARTAADAVARVEKVVERMAMAGYMRRVGRASGFSLEEHDRLLADLRSALHEP
jgi:hypothetical protein